MNQHKLMNPHANVFLKISEFYMKPLVGTNIIRSKEKAIFYLKKAIEYNANNLELNQDEIDLLIKEYGSKENENINSALLFANVNLLRKSKELDLSFLVDKYFELKGIPEILFKFYNTTFN